MIPAARLIEEARALVGTPCVPGGRNRFGVDCLGLLYVAAQSAGVDVYAHPAHQAALARFGDRLRTGVPPLGGLPEFLAAFCVPAPAALPGALIVLRAPHEPHPRHFAICTGPTLIHVSERLGAVEHGYRMRFLTATHSRWLLPGIAYDVP